jgi:hypothetical protein
VKFDGPLEVKLVLGLDSATQAQLDRIEQQLDSLKPVEVEVFKPGLIIKIGPFKKQKA